MRVRGAPKVNTHLMFGYRRRYRATTNSNHRQPVFENRLERDFAAQAPDPVYAGDITYVWTPEGWLYLAVVIDLYSRKVVGWSMGRRLNSTWSVTPCKWHCGGAGRRRGS